MNIKFNQQNFSPTVNLYTYISYQTLYISQNTSSSSSLEIKQRPDTDYQKVTNPTPSRLSTMRVDVSSFFVIINIISNDSATCIQNTDLKLIITHFPTYNYRRYFSLIDLMNELSNIYIAPWCDYWGQRERHKNPC